MFWCWLVVILLKLICFFVKYFVELVLLGNGEIDKRVIVFLIVKVDDIFVFFEIGIWNIYVIVFMFVIVVFYVYVKEKLREVVVFV